MSATLLKFPGNNVQNIPESLRKLADGIENGEYGDCHNLCWVIDEGNSSISIGLLGESSEPAPLAYFLMGIGQRKLEGAL